LIKDKNSFYPGAVILSHAWSCWPRPISHTTNARYMHLSVPHTNLYYPYNAKYTYIHPIIMLLCHLRLNFWPDIVGAELVDFVLGLPHMGHAKFPSDLFHNIPETTYRLLCMRTSGSTSGLARLSFCNWCKSWSTRRTGSSPTLREAYSVPIISISFTHSSLHLPGPLTFPMPFWPRVAEVLPLSPPFEPEPAGDP
jgi:hypothetical protein